MIKAITITVINKTQFQGLVGDFCSASATGGGATFVAMLHRLPVKPETAADSLLPMEPRLLRPSAPARFNPEGSAFKILSFWEFSRASKPPAFILVSSA